MSLFLKDFTDMRDRNDKFDYKEYVDPTFHKQSNSSDLFFWLIIAFKSITGVFVVGFLTYNYNRAVKYEEDFAPATKSTVFFN